MIEEDIRSAPEKTVEEKRAMVDILQRMADPNAFPDGDFDSDDEQRDEEEEDLAQKLKEVDLGAAVSCQQNLVAKRIHQIQPMRIPFGMHYHQGKEASSPRRWRTQKVPWLRSF